MLIQRRSTNMESTTSASMNSTIYKTAEAIENSCMFHRASIENVNSSMPYVVNAVLNVKLSVVATLLNALSFSAIRKIRNLHLPSKLLLCSLVLTDLGVGVVTQPLFVAFLISKLKSTAEVQCILLSTFVVTSSIFGLTSVMLMTAISIDRYAALSFHIRYRQIVTAKRVRLLLVLVWLPGPLVALSGLLNISLQVALSLIVVPVSLAVIFLAYFKIYRGLQHFARQREEIRASGWSFNLPRYRQLTSGMIWLKIVFVLCFLPCACTMVLIQFRGFTAVNQCILEFSATIIHLNACLNPLTYTLHLPGVRRFLIEKLRNKCD